MKRFILTSICTLVLSLLGAFGANQNLLNSNVNSIPTDNVGNVTTIENGQSLPSDNQTNVADVTTPAAETTDSYTVTNNDTKDNNQDVITELQATSDNKVNVQEVSTKSVNSDNGNHYNTTGKQALVYKKVNLSNCKSASDVVKVLRKNGYTGINTNNIKNIKSLKDILKIIQGSKVGNTCTTPSPTTAPAPTAKPTPTTAPAPTVKPTPTTAPVPTAKPTPTAAPAPTVTPAPSTGNQGTSSYASEVLRLVNIERAMAGLSAYTTNSSITAAANKRAQEIKQSFSHTRLDGSNFSTALTDYNVTFRTAGENIAYGQKTPQGVVNAWMNSPGHRANILNSNFNKIGIGVYEVNGVYYWTQEFTN